MTDEQYSRHLVRMARRHAGITQSELAARASTSQAAISAYESGRRSPSVETLSRILRAAGLELRMRLAEPDTHDSTRLQAEKLLPRTQLDEYLAREERRTELARGRRRLRPRA